MAKVSASLDVSNVDGLEQVKRFVTIALKDIGDQVNGNLLFSDNISSALVTLEFTAPNQELRFDHTLNRVANNYILCKSSVSATLFDGSTTNVKNSTYIKCTAASTVTVLIF